MANMLFANNCNTTLNGSITNVATSMVVTSATGFPVPTGSQYFYCTLADAATQTTIEIVKVTAVSGTTFTIVRGQDGTTGTIFASGAVVSLRLVRASLQDFALLDEANTFSGPSSTFTNAPTFNTALSVGSGGTGLTSLTAGYIPYGNGTSAFSSSANLSFDGTNLSVTGKSYQTGGARTGHVYKSGIASGIATTLFSAATAGMYQVFVTPIVADAANYGAFATVIVDGTARIVSNNAALVTLTLSGTNVQCTQSLGSAQDLKASWTFMPNES